MTITLQLLLIAFCIGLLGVIVHQISKSRIIFSDFNYWIIFVLFLLIIAVFPKFVEFVAQVAGIQTPVFAVFLMVIFLLILIVLSCSFRISVLNRRSIQLVQKIALLEESLEERIQALEKSEKQKNTVSKKTTTNKK